MKAKKVIVYEVEFEAKLVVAEMREKYPFLCL